MNKLRSYLASAMQYLGDAAHRRFVASAIALVATTVVGHAIGGDQVSAALDIVVGGFAGAWSRTTPTIAGAQ